MGCAGTGRRGQRGLELEEPVRALVLRLGQEPDHALGVLVYPPTEDLELVTLVRGGLERDLVGHRLVLDADSELLARPGGDKLLNLETMALDALKA